MAELAVQNLILRALLELARTEFALGTYSQQPLIFRRRAPTIPQIQKDAEAGGSVSLYAMGQDKTIVDNHRQTNQFGINCWVVIASSEDDQEEVGIDFLADVEAIFCRRNALRITVPSTSAVVPVNLKARASRPTNANALPKLGGGLFQMIATYATRIGDPRNAAP